MSRGHSSEALHDLVCRRGFLLPVDGIASMLFFWWETETLWTDTGPDPDSQYLKALPKLMWSHPGTTDFMQ